MRKLRIGVVGCGNISGIYFENLARFPETEVVTCADLDRDRAREASEKWGIPRHCETGELLSDPEVDLVLNLTVPSAHFEVSRAALVAGKHVYVEKPLAVERAEGEELVRLAQSRSLRIGCAPDTVLGAGIQTCRKLIADGAIGAPVGANAFMLCPGHESWHPSPEFYYRRGGGPMLDMGPYYLSALATLLGPMSSVSAEARITRAIRTIESEPLRGREIRVETPTHITGVIAFARGAIAQVSTSFDVQRTTLPCIEVYGETGTMLVPDPNGFGGPVRVFRKWAEDWEDVALTHPYSENSRGLGVAEMAAAIDRGLPHRASGSFALHVLDAMHAFLESAEAGRRRDLAPFDDVPPPMPGTGS